MCRITKQLRNTQLPGDGLHPYFLTQEIQQPTLIITKKHCGNYFPLPSYAVIKEISYQDVAFTWNLRKEFFEHGAKGFRQKLDIVLRLAHKFMEIWFFLKSIPYLLKFRPDIVHVHGLICIPGGIFSKSVMGSRFVITLHAVTEVALVRKFRFLRCFVRAANKIICVSDALKNSLADVVPAKQLEVIPTGVDLELFKDLSLQRKNQLISVGAFKWQKGYAHLIEAIAALSGFGDYRLLIIGDGPQKQEIEKQISDRGLSDRIHLLGLLSQTEIVRHLNESKLFVMSSLAEGFPKVLLEALACGTPAVVTKACNAEGIIDRVGVAVEPGDGWALARAIEEVLADERRWQKLSANCLDVVREYGWTNVAARTLEVYKRL
jgi:glycosyltransferase involved in cell wall biosynthesis